MTEFEKLLSLHRGAVERLVRFKVPMAFDADDILQETYIAAERAVGTLSDPSEFKPYILGIARNKIADYYRAKARRTEIPLDTVTERGFSYGRYGISAHTAVRETIAGLAEKDREILYDFFFLELPQAKIAKKRGIPLGTVKSRLYTAKQNFKEKYPYQPKSKGDDTMKKLPLQMPEYSIAKSEKEPFPVVFEELMGWFLVPRLGEKLSWAMYDMPSRKRGEAVEMEVIGKAEVHGIEGVEIAVHEQDPMDCNAIGGQKEAARSFVAQLTDTHCRLLAEGHIEHGVKKYHTFLDGEEFHENWGFGENNIGNETHLRAKGDILRSGNVITTKDKRFLLDIVGCYTVMLMGKTYETVCIMDVETYNGGVVTEQFIDKNGRTVLWRRFNSDTWAFSRYNKTWSDLLPSNERLTVNGKTYVHWYDCITDYII